MTPPLNGNDISKPILEVIHSFGFFSCCTVRLLGIIAYTSAHGFPPEVVDSREQFGKYKHDQATDLSGYYFQSPRPHDCLQGLHTPNPWDIQFIDYRSLPLSDICPFVDRYFTVQDHIVEQVGHLEEKHSIDYENTCAVFYRGNDKFTETAIAPYDAFIAKAAAVKLAHPSVRFLMQTDETEFSEAFLARFPDCSFSLGMPNMPKCNATLEDTIRSEDKPAFGATFLSVVKVISKCKQIVTHSGNGSLWAVLFREHCDGLHQILNGEWFG